MNTVSTKRPEIRLLGFTTLLLALSACGGGGSGGGGNSTPLPTPEIRIADASLIEGNSGTSSMLFAVTLSEPSTEDIRLNYSTNSITASIDDFGFHSGSLTIAAGQTQANIEVLINGDIFFEPDETFSVNLENLPTNVIPTDIQAFGTIRADDIPGLAFNGVEEVSVIEGDTASRFLVYRLRLEGPTNEISIDYATEDNSATVADNDYIPVSGTLVIPAGQTDAEVLVEVVGDTRPETDEQVVLRLSNLQGDAIQLSPVTHNGNIIDNDSIDKSYLTLNVPYVSIEEGDSGTRDLVFTIRTNRPIGEDIFIDYETVDINDAESGVDYNAISGQVVIPANTTQTQFSVQIIGDTVPESIEQFGVDLTILNILDAYSDGGAVLTGRVMGGILDDDGPAGLPEAVIQPEVSIIEGNSDYFELPVIVNLTGPAATQVEVDYTTFNGTALAGSDYTAQSGTLIFAPGETAKTITLVIHGDQIVEANEQFKLVLTNVIGDANLSQIFFQTSVTIITDEPFAFITINDTEINEGDSGLTNMPFTVSMDAHAQEPVTLDYVIATSIGSNPATAGEDYVAASGTLTINPGSTQTTVNVQISGDTDNEFDEDFIVRLSNPSQNAEINDNEGRGVIVNDDGEAGWSDPQALPQSGQDNVLPRVAIDTSGNAIVIWAPLDIGQFENSRYTLGAGWSAVDSHSGVNVSGNARVDRDVYIQSNGLATHAWADGLVRSAQQVNGALWSSTYIFDPSAFPSQQNLQLAGNASGQMMAVWKLNSTTPNTDHLMFSVYDPMLQQWSSADFIQQSALLLETPRVVMHSNGDALVIWSEQLSRLGVWASYYDADVVGNKWSTPIIISEQVSPGVFSGGYELDLTMDASGNAIAVWDSELAYGGTPGDVWACRFVYADYINGLNNDGWSEAIPIEFSALDTTHAQVAADASGNAYAVWLQDSDSPAPGTEGYDIWFSRYDVVADNWGTPARVADSNLRVSTFGTNNLSSLDLPALAVDAAGNAILAWSENVTGDFVIRASRYDPVQAIPEWTAPQNISGNIWPFAIFPDIAVDALGNAIVVWQAGNTEAFEDTDISEVWWSRFTP